jgi:hypothetical protein
MLRLFAVRWPLGARFEVAALFPISVFALSLVTPIRDFASSVAASTLSQEHASTAVAIAAPWFVLACLTAVPYVGLLIVVDRLLAARKGFALLAIFATATWTGAAALLTREFSGTLDATYTIAGADIRLIDAAIFGVFMLSLLIHIRPFTTGLRDRGFVGLRLRVGREESNVWRRPQGPDQLGSGAWVAPNPRGRNRRPGVIMVRRMLPWGLIAAIALNAYSFRYQIIDLARLIGHPVAIGPQPTGSPVAAGLSGSLPAEKPSSRGDHAGGGRRGPRNTVAATTR